MLGLSIPSVAYRNPASLAARVNALFRNGEQGVWFDPSDISTLYQDAAGTTPVTAMEQPVGLMLDKSKGLVLGTPLTISSVDVTPLGGTAVDNGDGTYTVSGGGYVRFYYNLADLKQGAFYKVEVEVLSGTGSYLLQWCDEGNTIKTGAGVVSVIATRVYDSIYRFVDFEGCSTNDVTFKLLSVRELPGNHCVFKSGTGRPVLSARYNLLTYSEKMNNAPWSAPAGGASASGNVITFTDQGKTWAQAVTTTATIGTAATFSVDLSGSGTIYIGVSRSGASTYEHTLLKVTLTETPTRYSVSHTIANAGATGFSASIGTSTDGTARVVTATKADMRYTNDGIGLPAYQRVVDSATYDTAGFPAYLRADGTDDGGSTNSIDFTGTDKITVFAGVRKMSDAAAGIITELGTNTQTVDGAFNVLGPGAAAATTYRTEIRGTVAATGVSSTGFVSPISNVFSVGLDNAGSGTGNSAQIKPRVNGADKTAASGTSAGNFGNYPLFLFARNNASLYFNGRLYGLIVLGRAATATEIANTERYLNMKGRLY